MATYLEEVQALTLSTTALLSAVNVKKVVLDAAVENAQTSAAAAAGAATIAAGIAATVAANAVYTDVQMALIEQAAALIRTQSILTGRLAFA